MKNVTNLIALFCSALFFSVHAVSADAKKSNDPVRIAIEKSLQKIRPQFSVQRVEKTGIADLYEVYFSNGGMVYATANGSHLFEGKILRIEGDQIVDVREEKIKPVRAKALAGIAPDKKIIFSPAGQVKAYVDVFTDVDCGYCQKLHSHMAEYNELGIEVRYLAFPRAGPNSMSAKRLISAWCADDRKDAMTKLKTRQKIPDKNCENPVASQYELGQNIGVNGTPAMYTKDGTLIGGYLDPAQLAEALGVQK